VRRSQVGVCAHDIAGLGSDKTEDVGADVVSAEGVETPIGFNGRNIGIVGIECRVDGTDKRGRDCASEQDSVYFVLGSTTILIKCWTRKR
jgi:hypothetical protein